MLATHIYWNLLNEHYSLICIYIISTYNFYHGPESGDMLWVRREEAGGCVRPWVIERNGSCKEEFTKYYFDIESQTCKIFIYGGN